MLFTCINVNINITIHINITTHSQTSIIFGSVRKEGRQEVGEMEKKKIITINELNVNERAPWRGGARMGEREREREREKKEYKTDSTS